MIEEKTPDEFKLVLDKLEDFHDITRIFEHMSTAELVNYFDGLSDTAWRHTTGTEWQSYVMHLSSQCFKGILDEMTREEILSIWNNFDDMMSRKFFTGLEMADIYNFTEEEWNAAFIGFSASDFKTMFFDRMDFKGIMFVSDQIDVDMDDFLDELTLKDWRHFTAAEWEAFLTGQDLDDIVDFIHEMHEEDPKVVEDMFAAMPKEMLDDFRNTPELSYQFTK